MISPILLYLTLIAIFWYSWETRGLRAQTVLQNELVLRPRIIFYANPAGSFWVKNIGNGAALDVEIKDYSLDVPCAGKVIFKFECQNILEVGHSSELSIKIKNNGETDDCPSFFLVQFKPLVAPHTHEIRFEYKNVLGKKYDEDTSRLGKEMLQITSIRA